MKFGILALGVKKLEKELSGLELLIELPEIEGEFRKICGCSDRAPEVLFQTVYGDSHSFEAIRRPNLTVPPKPVWCLF